MVKLITPINSYLIYLQLSIKIPQVMTQHNKIKKLKAIRKFLKMQKSNNITKIYKSNQKVLNYINYHKFNRSSIENNQIKCLNQK